MTNLLSALPPSYTIMYGPAPVIPYAPNADAERAHQWDWTGKTTAIPSGLTVASVNPPHGTETFPLHYTGLTRADVRAIESFVEDRVGRVQGFWCPTFQHDFYVSAATLQLRDWGYASSIFPLSVLDPSTVTDYWTRHFAAWYAGEWMVSRFLDIAGTGVDAEGFSIVQYSFGGGTGPDVVSGHTSAQGLMVSRLLWVRFADDAMTTEWAHPNFASVSLRVVPIPYESPRF